ncbi:MAG: hypothetical protein ACYSUQ_12590, partial [Planctomycetota bacterium]
MWLSLFCLLLIAGIAFFQSIHGLLSSLIFCVLTILWTALAFALYEYVAYEYLFDLLGKRSDFALPLALALCFAVPLIASRIAMDQMIQRSSLLPALADKIGGMFFGIITAMLIVGVLATSVEMLPFGRTFLGFARF